MAMIKCSECGKDISDKAANCIHCGNPILNNDEFGKVIVKFKLPKNQAITSPAISIIDNKNELELVKVKVEHTIEFYIKDVTEIYAKQWFVKTKNTVSLDPNKVNKVLVTFAGMLNNKLTLNLVDSFVE